jgi:hypothetical protein
VVECFVTPGLAVGVGVGASGEDGTASTARVVLAEFESDASVNAAPAEPANAAIATAPADSSTTALALRSTRTPERSQPDATVYFEPSSRIALAPASIRVNRHFTRNV